MKTLFLLWIIHICVCIVVGYFSITTSTTTHKPVVSEVAQDVRRSEISGTISTEGFSIGGSTRSSAINGAVVIYFLSGVVGLLLASSLELLRWIKN